MKAEMEQAPAQEMEGRALANLRSSKAAVALLSDERTGKDRLDYRRILSQ